MKCGFIGHRDIVDVEETIYTYIEKMIAMGVREFYSGGMGNFDKMCEKQVKKAGGKIIFVPYNKKQIKPSDLLWYDEIVCPFGDKPYSKNDIPKRNEFLVDMCDVFLCCVYKKGGAKSTFDYAVSKRKQVINLYFC